MRLRSLSAIIELLAGANLIILFEKREEKQGFLYKL